ncbi:hypothetical protein PC129_g12278 [Phytophthora cactorum]|uniref:Uncharacterized protein n=1 Tax=Phytophthora cactorum TaxID=29920 RepID=A0A329RRB3_9STRA|nr:hypothetical protein Pcac1_g19962 [Phytophthora cactorum]KAG2803078.1 hypothetical protein PC112_g19338 [Phytophthora cactorum]KAG2804298.1 hypothetical protein PC111_g18314 [Phytophthora cactorum]KAG2854234.1 hypothetical protein PC113_g13487 [Phytophthora cactorum]KAG2885857.1 hypothetical protein PC114_g19507 [Phytophthora cactorum]
MTATLPSATIAKTTIATTIHRRRVDDMVHALWKLPTGTAAPARSARPAGVGHRLGGTCRSLTRTGHSEIDDVVDAQIPLSGEQSGRRDCSHAWRAIGIAGLLALAVVFAAGSYSILNLFPREQD